MSMNPHQRSRTGLQSAEQFFYQAGLPMLRRLFPDQVELTAAGLVGEGSECFGFDDHLSRDHDWETGFCLWLEPDDFDSLGPSLQLAYQELIRLETGRHIPDADSPQRRGVFSTPVFFQRFLGRGSRPQNLNDWLKLPEEYLAVCTNGKVFHDPLGSFSDFRNHLLDYYPEDVRLKKIAARCVSLAQDGQYNYPRSLQRGDVVSANHALARFIHAACSLTYLLQKRYKPFYKWMHRGLKGLETPGPQIADLLERLSEPPGDSQNARNQDRLDNIEECAVQLIGALNDQGLSSSSSSLLMKHAPVIQDLIQDPQIRAMPWGTG